MAGNERRFTIYALCDPRPEYQGPHYELWGVRGVRYVGQTFKSIQHRLAGHLVEEGNPYKRNWVRSLRDQGLKPEAVVIQEGIPSQEEADRIEIERIAEAREKLGGKLINLTEGGQGGYYSDELMEQSRTRALAGPDGYERPGNTPYTNLRDMACASVRRQMLEPGNVHINEIDYTAERSSLKQLSTIQVGTGAYHVAYDAGLHGKPLPDGKLVEEAGYLHGRLAREGFAEPLENRRTGEQSRGQPHDEDEH